MSLPDRNRWMGCGKAGTLGHRYEENGALQVCIVVYIYLPIACGHSDQAQAYLEQAPVHRLLGLLGEGVAIRMNVNVFHPCAPKHEMEYGCSNLAHPVRFAG